MKFSDVMEASKIYTYKLGEVVSSFRPQNHKASNTQMVQDHHSCFDHSDHRKLLSRFCDLQLPAHTDEDPGNILHCSARQG